MSREILFRGFEPESRTWVYGGYWQDEESTFIKEFRRDIRYGSGVRVIPETVGQFTGLLLHGVKIFEGDIIGGYPHGTVEVEYDAEWGCWNSVMEEWTFDDEHEDGYDKRTKNLLSNDLRDCSPEWKVIGNIHDNAELLEK